MSPTIHPRDTPAGKRQTCGQSLGPTVNPLQTRDGRRTSAIPTSACGGSTSAVTTDRHATASTTGSSTSGTSRRSPSKAKGGSASQAGEGGGSRVSRSRGSRMGVVEDHFQCIEPTAEGGAGGSLLGVSRSCGRGDAWRRGQRGGCDLEALGDRDTERIPVTRSLQRVEDPCMPRSMRQVGLGQGLDPRPPLPRPGRAGRGILLRTSASPRRRSSPPYSCRDGQESRGRGCRLLSRGRGGSRAEGGSCRREDIEKGQEEEGQGEGSVGGTPQRRLQAHSVGPRCQREARADAESPKNQEGQEEEEKGLPFPEQGILGGGDGGVKRQLEFRREAHCNFRTVRERKEVLAPVAPCSRSVDQCRSVGHARSDDDSSGLRQCSGGGGSSGSRGGSVFSGALATTYGGGIRQRIIAPRDHPGPELARPHSGRHGRGEPTTQGLRGHGKRHSHRDRSQARTGRRRSSFTADHTGGRRSRQGDADRGSDHAPQYRSLALGGQGFLQRWQRKRKRKEREGQRRRQIQGQGRSKRRRKEERGERRQGVKKLRGAKWGGEVVEVGRTLPKGFGDNGRQQREALGLEEFHGAVTRPSAATGLADAVQHTALRGGDEQSENSLLVSRAEGGERGVDLGMGQVDISQSVPAIGAEDRGASSTAENVRLPEEGSGVSKEKQL